MARCPGPRCVETYALLALCDKYGDGRVEAICQSALAFDLVDVNRLTKMLKSARRSPRSPSGGDKVVQLSLLPPLRSSDRALRDPLDADR